MNISSSVGQTAPFGQLSTTNNSNKPGTPSKDSVRSVDAVVEAEKEQKQSSNSYTAPSIVLDEQAIALFEQSRPTSSPEQFSQDSSSLAGQDQPSVKNESAVANYQAVGNLAQRESVQKMFGVDLFA